MRRIALSLLFIAVALLTNGVARAAAQPPVSWVHDLREPSARLIGLALADTAAWQRLAEMTDRFGHRLAGSTGLEQTILWAADSMRADGLENVRTEKVMVPHWVRGAEQASIVEPVAHPMAMLGLGNSVGTPAGGIRAEIVPVRSYDELERKGRAGVEGRIVFYNVPWTNYGETVQYRASGPSRAARLGAVAVILRAVGQPGLRTPHTGALSYADDAPKIPAAAVALEDADRLQRLHDRHGRVVVHLAMGARMLPDAESANVIGEVRGREFPEQLVVVGCHIDSWDVGTGAMDDGGGCIAAWEVLRLVKRAGLRPRRTLRAVLFTNEENGLRGGTAYAETHRDELAHHVMMMESDGGPFRPLGFGFSGSDAARALVREASALLAGIDAAQVRAGGGGADIGPAVRAGNVPAMSPIVDGSTYFTLHHTEADTVDKINPLDMARHVAAMAVMSYAVADMPQRLPR